MDCTPRATPGHDAGMFRDDGTATSGYLGVQVVVIVVVVIIAVVAVVVAVVVVVVVVVVAVVETHDP